MNISVYSKCCVDWRTFLSQHARRDYVEYVQNTHILLKELRVLLNNKHVLLVFCIWLWPLYETGRKKCRVGHFWSEKELRMKEKWCGLNYVTWGVYQQRVIVQKSVTGNSYIDYRFLYELFILRIKLLDVMNYFQVKSNTKPVVGTKLDNLNYLTKVDSFWFTQRHGSEFDVIHVKEIRFYTIFYQICKRYRLIFKFHSRVIDGKFILTQMLVLFIILLK